MEDGRLHLIEDELAGWFERAVEEMLKRLEERLAAELRLDEIDRKAGRA